MKIRVCPEAPTRPPPAVYRAAYDCIWCGEPLADHRVLESAPGTFTIPSVERQAHAETVAARTDQVQDATVEESR